MGIFFCRVGTMFLSIEEVLDIFVHLKHNKSNAKNKIT